MGGIAVGSGELLRRPEELLVLVSNEPLDVPAPQFSLEATVEVADFLAASAGRRG